MWRLTHQEDSRYGQLTFETYHTAVLAHEIQQDLLKTKRHALRVALTAQQPLSRLHRSDPPKRCYIRRLYISCSACHRHVGRGKFASGISVLLAAPWERDCAELNQLLAWRRLLRSGTCRLVRPLRHDA